MSKARRILSEARALHGAGRLTEAEQLYRKLLRKAPRDGEIWYGLGTLYLQKGDGAAAVEPLDRATRLLPSNPQCHLNLGNARMMLGEIDAACTSFARAAAVAPDPADACFALGFAEAERARPAAAEAAYRRALAARPDFLDVLNNLGGVLQTQGRAAEAAEYYRRAARLAPRSIDVLANLALVLEMINDLDGAQATAQQALELAPSHPTMRLLLGQLALRRSRLGDARSSLEQLLADAPPPPIAAEAWHTIGLVHDRAGDAGAAFRAASRGNRIGRDVFRAAGVDGARYRAHIAACSAFFTAERLADGRRARTEEPTDKPTDKSTGGPAGEAAADRAPVFFVGFPRSGTTLLEEILAAHPAILTTSERSPITAAQNAAIKAAGGDIPYPDCLDRLDAAEIGAAGAAYWARAEAEFGDRLAGKLLVDKLPFNIVELGFIDRILPHSRVIVALRDPRDVCLSCFLQHFQQNDAMANFMDLRSTAEIYDATMTLWLRYRNNIGMPWLEYRYEDLVTAPEPTLRRIIAFIGVEWQSDLLESRHTRRDRYVVTPSRDAVQRPISTSAVGRWRAYADPLGPILPVLAPWLERFGYEMN